MARWLRALFVAAVGLAAELAFAALLLLQALAVGVSRGAGACLALCIAAIPTLLAMLAAHELGHLAAGKAVGFPFARFTVGPLAVERIAGRLRARLNTAWFQPAAYVVHSLPGNQVARWRRAAFVAGGPLASLLLGVACLVAADGLHPGPPDVIAREAREGWRSVALLVPGSMATAQLNVAGLLSVGLGLATLVPGRAAGLRSDGGQLVDLWRARACA